MSEPQDPTRKPGLDDEVDGLECFATESVADVHEAHDAAVAEFEEVLPAVRVASLPPEPRRATRQAVVVATPDVLPPARISPPPMWRRSWPGARVTAVALVFLLVGVGGMWMNLQRGRPKTAAVAVRSAPPSATPVVPSAPAAPTVANGATAPSRAEAVAANPPATVAARPREAAAPMTTAPATSSPVRAEAARRPAVAPPAQMPETPAATEPDTAPMPVETPAVALEAPVIATPEVVRAEPASEVAPAPVAVITPPPNDRASIERVLQQYRDAYDRLDAPSAAVIWPRVDTRALSRAFSTLASQDLSFDRCDLAITGVKASAQCTGAIRYVRRVGDQQLRVRRMSWSFAFERVSDRWQIAQVTAD
jgi:hypothetical protein